MELVKYSVCGVDCLMGVGIPPYVVDCKFVRDVRVSPPLGDDDETHDADAEDAATCQRKTNHVSG